MPAISIVAMMLKCGRHFAVLESPPIMAMGVYKYGKVSHLLKVM